MTCHPSFAVAYPAAWKPVPNPVRPSDPTPVETVCPDCGQIARVETVRGDRVTLVPHEEE